MYRIVHHLYFLALLLYLTADSRERETGKIVKREADDMQRRSQAGFHVVGVWYGMIACNSLYSCLNLKTFISSATWLLTQTKRGDHNSPILATLHWIPCY